MSVQCSLVYPQRANTVVFLPKEPHYLGTRKHYSVIKVLSGLYHLDGKIARGYTPGMKKRDKTSALTVRFTEEEKAMIVELRTYYGLSSDNEALRFALRAAKREMERLRVETSEKPA